MARPLRIGWDEQIHHVFHRGLERREVFQDRREREHFLERVGELPDRFGVEVRAWCLMDNHYHLLLRTPRDNLSASMHWLNVSYGVWLNRRRQRLGPVFAGRFGSIPVEGSAVKAVTQYIHLNPIRTAAFGWDKRVRAQEHAGVAADVPVEVLRGRVRQLRAYRWSSYRAYAGYAPGEGWLTVNPETQGAGAAIYRRETERAVLRGQEETLWAGLSQSVAVGSAAFAERIRRALRGKMKREWSGRRTMAEAVPWCRIVAAVESARGASWQTLCKRRGDGGREMAFWFGRRTGGLTLRQLGELAGGVDYAAVSMALKRFESRIAKDMLLRRSMQEMKQRLLSTVDS